MPLVHLPRPAESNPISLFYKIQGADGKPELDPRKQTILLLHATFGDVNGLDTFFNDTRLRRRVNMIAFDQRSHGQTQSTVAPTTDMAVCAADIVLALRELNITQKLHVVCTVCSSPVIANNLAALFPDRFLSFTLYGMPLVESDRNLRALEEVADFLLHPRDPMEFLQGIDGSFELQFGAQSPGICFITDDIETIISKVAVGRYSPAAARRQWEAWNHAVHRPKLKEEFFAQVKSPVLVYHGREDIGYTTDEAEEFASLFVNAPVQLKELDGPYACFRTHPSELNTILLQFLSSNFDLVQDSPPTTEQSPLSASEIATALYRSAIMRGEKDPGASISWEEPLISENFCTLTKDVVEANAREIENLVEIENQHRNWIPIRNYWENHQQDQDFDFRFKSRHDYFRDFHGSRTSRIRE